VDGRIELLDDWFDPSRSDADVADLQQEMERQGRDSDALLVGRQTFEDLRGYWPQHLDTPTGAYLDQVQKYVVSSSMTDPAWQDSTVLPGDPVEEVRRLKDSDGGTITLTGSITLTHVLLLDRTDRRDPAVRLPGRSGPRKRTRGRGHHIPPAEAAGNQVVPVRGDAVEVRRRKCRSGHTAATPARAMVSRSVTIR
jgi:hypothetical protein